MLYIRYDWFLEKNLPHCVLTRHSRRSTTVTNLTLTLVSQNTHLQGPESPEWNAAIINVINYTCAQQIEMSLALERIINKFLFVFLDLVTWPSLLSSKI